MMKDQLLSHAEDLARRRGVDAFSFADLAKGAGIRKASVHHHFPTKADMSLALMKTYAERTLDALRTADDQPAGARLTHILNLYRDALNGGDSLCLCVSFTASRPSLSPETRACVARFQSDVQDWLRTAFTDALTDKTIAGVADPGAEADACFALIEGAQLAARATQSLDAYDKATALLRSRIRAGAPT